MQQISFTLQKSLILLVFVLFYTALSAGLAQSKSISSSEIYHSIQKLNAVGSVMYVAAHPDDENTRLLSFFESEANLRVGYLSLTRGDGGQNLIGKELGDELGMIRTQELLAARKIDGAEQFFTRAVDFGYSKSPDETIEKWGFDAILSDVVYVMRQFKPDIVICRFPTTGEGGHGHHTASAILADSAFFASADPSRYPSSKPFGVWQPQTLVWNTFNFGGNNTIRDDQIKMDIGMANPLLGKTYGEIAAASRTMHKSQGFGSAANRGEILEYFKPIRGKSDVKSLVDVQDFTWNRFGEMGKSIGLKVNAIVNSFDFKAPQKSINDLVALRSYLSNLKVTDPLFSHYIKLKLKDIEHILFNCAGLYVELNTNIDFALEGTPLECVFTVVPTLSDQVRLVQLEFPDGYDTLVQNNLAKNISLSFKHSMIPKGSHLDQSPYWLRSEKNGDLYTFEDYALTGHPESKPYFMGKAKFMISSQPFEVDFPLMYKTVDPTKGEVRQPIYLLPDVYVSDLPDQLLFNGEQEKNFTFKLHANKGKKSGQLEILNESKYTIEPSVIPFQFQNAGEVKEITIKIRPPKMAINDQSGAITFSILGKTDIQQKWIKYDHIPALILVNEASLGLKQLNIEIGKKSRIAYIPGAGDEVAASLKDVGYKVDIINVEELYNVDLSGYDAVITGIRAYNVHENLFSLHHKLMDYVFKGGNFIVQYNTNNRVGPLKGEIGPYPFSITRERVTKEEAEVKFMNPDDPVLNFPNKLSPTDFDHWVQERGIYFAGEKDQKYRSVFEIKDPGEKSNEGSLIIGKYGKGNFVYTGLVFFRQLPAGVPGAYRLFANIINLPNNE